MNHFQVLCGNNLDKLKDFPDNYFDAIVTDPPYGLGNEPNAEEMLKAWIENGYLEVKGVGFMGKEWDAFVPQPLFWKEAFRVLKHGGHIVSFFGTRTYDWGVMAMRLAGFEVRDCIQWIYGSGFPKSHNISKAIDKMQGAEREVVGKKECGYQVSISKTRLEQGHRPNLTNSTKEVNITAPATEQAKQWDGWGSALKPANEPIVLARKPLEKGLSIAENVLKWGTGGINIDGCRVGSDLIKGQKEGQDFNNVKGFGVNTKLGNEKAKEYISNDVNGRFPANVIHDGSDEVLECFPDNKGAFSPVKSGQKGFGGEIYGKYSQAGDDGKTFYNDGLGSASRFFYCAKASKAERNKGLEGLEQKTIKGRDKGQDERAVAYKIRPTPTANTHPTIKPIKLMQYLIRLITPPNGIVLDPFMGSGTTGVACKLEGFSFVGIEMNPEYHQIAKARIENYIDESEMPDMQIKKSEKKNKHKKDDQLKFDFL